MIGWVFLAIGVLAMAVAIILSIRKFRFCCKRSGRSFVVIIEGLGYKFWENDHRCSRKMPPFIFDTPSFSFSDGSAFRGTGVVVKTVEEFFDRLLYADDWCDWVRFFPLSEEGVREGKTWTREMVKDLKRLDKEYLSVKI